ncbi:MAG: hypothetical protein ACWGOW_00055 [Gammaproteobacteria bacterium]
MAGRIGNSCGNALAGTIIGLYGTEESRHRGPLRDIDAVEYTPLAWIDWINDCRQFEPSGCAIPAEL